MRNLFLAFSLLSLASCSTTSQMQSQIVIPTSSDSPVVNFAKTSTTSNESLIDALVTAPELVTYGEDGAHDATVIALYIRNVDEVIPPKKEVRDIVALKDKAIPLLIECLDDTRPTSAIFIGGYISGKPYPKVPVGHVCLDILIQIAKNRDSNDKGCPRGEAELGACIKDGFYFRPDDYSPIGDGLGYGFQERAIVRIVKANWLKEYRNGRVKYDYVVTWK